LSEESIGKLPDSYRSGWELAVFNATGIMPGVTTTPVPAFMPVVQ